ncbi:MAG: uracil-DNA glycosylase [Ignavibacteriae bacterium]|nr:uracil-DNA glycosylase [Ignavibacteriota bacterium]NOG97263.1 uracil-DNA glycosylase [Ignavibacteriota bacterium]
MSSVKKYILESLKDQKEIFGDILYEKSINIEVKERQEIKSDRWHVAEKTEVKTDNNLFMEDFQKADNLASLNDMIKECQKCSLGKTRKSFVFGVGNPNADIMLIGEAPGADEDEQGIPFVGRAGKLLTDILIAINLQRDEVYIANIVKCRPPKNRNPLPEEMETCMPYLHKQIELVKPKVILCLGLVASNALLKNKSTLTGLRGNVYELNDIKVMATYHPAALLRNPNWKKGCWEDVKKFRKLYDELVARN